LISAGTEIHGAPPDRPAEVEKGLVDPAINPQRGESNLNISFNR
jgi:hypothetical protein